MLASTTRRLLRPFVALARPTAAKRCLAANPCGPQFFLDGDDAGWDLQRSWNIGLSKVEDDLNDSGLVEDCFLTAGICLDTMSMELAMGVHQNHYYFIYDSVTGLQANEHLSLVIEEWKVLVEEKEEEQGENEHSSDDDDPLDFVLFWQDDCFGDLFLSRHALGNLIGLEAELQQQLTAWDLRERALHVLSCPTRGASKALAARMGPSALQDFRRFQQDPEFLVTMQNRFDISDKEVSRRALVRRPGLFQ